MACQGNLTLDLAVDGKPIGTSYLQNVVVKPGDNNVDMTAKVKQMEVIDIISDDDSPYKDGNVPIQITGNSSYFNGEEIKYFSSALASNKLSVKLNMLDMLE